LEKQLADEIERRFLIHHEVFLDKNRNLGPGDFIVQGYLSMNPVVRVRTVDYGSNIVGMRSSAGFITVKGPKNNGKGKEYEYKILYHDAVEMLATLCQGTNISKVRHTIHVSPTRKWEVDSFLGENTGLAIAEIELGAIDEPIELPRWLHYDWTTGFDKLVPNEITDDHRYSNAALSLVPYTSLLKNL
jgi:adenylate cyclase